MIGGKLKLVVLGAGGIVSASTAFSQVQPDPEIVREPTVPTYVDREAGELLDQALRRKRPNVTRQRRETRCHYGQWFDRLPSLRRVGLVTAAFDQPEGPGGAADRAGQRQCRNVAVEAPYGGPRASDTFVEELVGIDYGDPVRVAIPDLVTEYMFDLTNCSSVNQTITQAVSYQVRTGEQITITNGIQTARSREMNFNISIPLSRAGGTIGFGGRSSVTRTITSNQARATSFDTTTTQQLNIPLTVPAMRQLRGTADGSQFSFEMPFVMRVRLNGTLAATSQYPAGPVSAELSPDERTVEVRGFVRVFLARGVRLSTRERVLTPEQCASDAEPS